MCTQSVQLNIGLRKKSLMGVLAHYSNICQLQEEKTIPRTASAVYCTAVNMYSLRNIWAEQNVCTSLNKNGFIDKSEARIYVTLEMIDYRNKNTQES